MANKVIVKRKHGLLEPCGAAVHNPTGKILSRGMGDCCKPAKWEFREIFEDGRVVEKGDWDVTIHVCDYCYQQVRERYENNGITVENYKYEED